MMMLIMINDDDNDWGWWMMTMDDDDDDVISASDDTILGSICDEVDPQVVRWSRIPKFRAAKGSEDFTKNNSR